MHATYEIFPHKYAHVMALCLQLGDFTVTSLVHHTQMTARITAQVRQQEAASAHSVMPPWFDCSKIWTTCSKYLVMEITASASLCLVFGDTRVLLGKIKVAVEKLEVSRRVWYAFPADTPSCGQT